MKYPDIGEVDDINVVDTLVDGTTPTARERRAFEAIKSLKKEREEKGDTIKIGKSKKLGSEEFERRVDVWIEEYTDAKAERIHRTKKK